MKDNLVLITKEGDALKIGSFNGTSIEKKDRYEHFLGKIILEEQIIPETLSSLLEKQQEYVNDGIFSVIDEINESINEFNIVIESTKERISDLYMEENRGDFKIYQ